MRATNFLLIATSLVLTSCQFNYTLPDPTGHKESSVSHTGYHGAHGSAYIAGRDACYLAKAEQDCTDEEWVEEYQERDGQGYYDSQWSADHADEMAAQQVYQCDDGTVIIVDDNGEIFVLENPSRIS